jgi:hypothetical protein
MAELPNLGPAWVMITDEMKRVGFSDEYSDTILYLILKDDDLVPDLLEADLVQLIRTEADRAAALAGATVADIAEWMHQNLPEEIGKKHDLVPLRSGDRLRSHHGRQ